jgi:taurine dioxygenase
MPNANRLTITPVIPSLGAEVRGIDLSGPISEADFATIRDAYNQYSVLVFPNQEMTPEAQVKFSSRFGNLMVHVLKEALLEGHPEIYRLSNKKKGGIAQGRPNAGQYWHSDLTYEAQPSLGSLLYGLEVPAVGGDTLFVSTAHAYETLSAPFQQMLEGLTATHLFAHAFRDSQGTSPKINNATFAERPPVSHPIIRLHPETGRKCLFVNPGFTVNINGMSDEESTVILDYLYHHMTRPEGILRHKWRDGDAVLWDNRALMHRGVGDYGIEDVRHMHRTTIEDPVGVKAA